MSRQGVSADFEVYGLPIRVSGDWPEVIDALRRDFIWFSGCERAPRVTVRIARRAPDRASLPPLKATRVTWRAAEYDDGCRTILDFGQVLAIDDRAGTLLVEGEHGWLAWRASHEFVLARIVEHLDRIGLALVAGLGLAGADGGVLVLLPMGGGKTTLALRVLREENVGLISEGNPILDREGALHAFPLPLLVRLTSPEASQLPAEHVRRIPGIDSDPTSLELSAFESAVPRRPVPLRHVVLGVRSLGPGSSLNRISWRHAAPAYTRATIGGFGVLRGGGARRLPSRLWAVRRRVAPFVASLPRTETWRLTIGRDKDANWDALARLL